MTDYSFTVRATDDAARVATSAQTLPVASWTPLDGFAGGVRGLWIDPSDLSSMFQDSAGTIAVTAAGQSVGKILDKSGNGNHLVQATSGKRPVLQQDGSGFYYLQFTAANSQFLSAGTTSALAPRTDSWQSVAGVRFDDGSPARSLYARSKATGVTGRYANQRNGAGQLVNFWDPTGTRTGSVPDGAAGDADASTAVRVISASTNRLAGLLQEWANRSSIGAALSFTSDAATDFNAAYRFLVGAYNNTTDSGEINLLNGRVYGLVLVFNSSTSTRSHAESFMAAKCGVTL